MFKFSKHNSSSSTNISQSVIQQQQQPTAAAAAAAPPQSHHHHHHHTSSSSSSHLHHPQQHHQQQQQQQQHHQQPPQQQQQQHQQQPPHYYYQQQQGHHKTESILSNNPLLNFFEVGKYVCSAGPEHVWKVYDGWRKCDGKEVSIFVFEKKMVEKKMKKKEMMADLLRASVKALERYRHPKILQVIYSVEECPETMAFASEPVHGSLSSLMSSSSSSSSNSSSSETVHINGPDSHPVFLDVELKYGILQIIEALQFLHYTGKMLHRNVNTSSILVTKRGTWKLSGLEFMEKANEIDGLESVHVIPWTSKVPKMAQPDLDYTAPEVQITSTCSILSDMFSLGLVITAIFNYGRPLVQSNHSNSQYLKQIEVIDSLLADFLAKVPPGLHEALQRLLSKEPRQRPTSQLLALIKYFADPAVHTLQFLDVISMKDPSQKANFYRHQLKDVLPYIPKKLWFQHVWPTLQAEMRSQEVLAAVLQPILLLIQECSNSEVENVILPTFRTVFAAPKSIQATVTLLENLNIVLEKVTEEGFMDKEVIPLLFNAFDSTTIQVQNSALISTALVAHHLDDAFIKKTVLPKTKQIYEKYTGDLKIVLNVLACLEKILPKLDRSMIIEDVLPILYDNAKTQDPDIIVKVVQIYRIMLEDNKKYGLSVNLMATRVLPSLLPQTVNPSLHLEQFTCLLEVMHHMLDHIDRNQRNKLKLDHLTAPQTSSIPNYHHHNNEYMSYQRGPGYKSLHHQRSSDNMSSYSGNMFIPNVQIDNMGGSPQGSNSYVSQRKTSSAEDMIRKTSSSDGANFLRVQGQSQFPIRRLSDNTLMAPKIRVAPSSALSSPGDPLPARRHSSIGPERKNSSSSVNLSPPMLARSSIVGGSMPNTTTSSIGNAFLSGSMSSLKSRRPSMLTSSNASVHSSSTLSGANTSGILQQLGTGVVGSKMVRRMSKQFFS